MRRLRATAARWTLPDFPAAAARRRRARRRGRSVRRRPPRRGRGRATPPPIAATPPRVQRLRRRRPVRPLARRRPDAVVAVAVAVGGGESRQRHPVTQTLQHRIRKYEGSSSETIDASGRDASAAAAADADDDGSSGGASAAGWLARSSHSWAVLSTSRESTSSFSSARRSSLAKPWRRPICRRPSADEPRRESRSTAASRASRDCSRSSIERTRPIVAAESLIAAT